MREDSPSREEKLAERERESEEKEKHIRTIAHTMHFILYSVGLRKDETRDFDY